MESNATNTGAPIDPELAAPIDPALAAPIDPALAAPIDPALAAPIDPALAAPIDPALAAPIDPELAELIDPELAELIEQCDAIDAELDKLSPEERNKRLYGSLGLPADASNEDILEDPSFPDFAEELAEAAQESTLISLSKDKLDESFVRILTGMLKRYDSLEPAERREKVLAMYSLGTDATDAELEAALRQEISESFEQPIPADIAEQCVKIILDKANV